MSKINFFRLIKNIQLSNKIVAKLIANKAVNHFKTNFRLGGFVDSTLEPWKKRKGEITGGISKLSKNSKGSRAVLVKSGTLRRSIKVIKVSPSSIVVGTNTTEYASYHNQGIGKIPERKFIGRSTALNNAIKDIWRDQIKNTLSKRIFK